MHLVRFINSVIGRPVVVRLRDRFQCYAVDLRVTGRGSAVNSVDVARTSGDIVAGSFMVQEG
ncbi:hypothetical protein [Nonomuraea zeae]|uniref:Uncharacterized protein n=1 Tax=Nonomuraea zeae TaxID=1642303 RepID=A0A5S4GDR3_9ACTN|nr:hypothetical protein [Nonomuraea zeae]TMR30912.1 hypothetical protein ETD85_27500 [Nonomuraea zeae]